MDTLLHRLGDKIKGCIEGFDRIVFKGTLRPIAFSLGMQAFLQSQGVLNKNYKDWVTKHSSEIIESANTYSQKDCGKDIIYIPSSHTRKEEVAHEEQKKFGVKEGLIGVWSCVEACTTFRSTFDATAGYPKLRIVNSRCKHLYFYYDHTDYGFMSIRLQTWAPYNIQIAINGREWLRRSLDKENCGYIVSGNKFLHIDNYELAQQLLNSQQDINWETMLNGFVQEVFPNIQNILGDKMSYYWTLWQSEIAKDYIFDSPQFLIPLMDNFLRHALITGTSDRVLKYMGHPVKKDGQPYQTSNPELFTRVNLWHDGLRIRHWVDQNSVKLYNEQNVLRFEMTMNNPSKYRIHRHKEGQDKTESKKLLPMRKGISDIHQRNKVSSDRVRAFTEHVATVSDKTPVGKLMKDITLAKTQNGRKVRGLDVLGKDMELLQAISDPKFNADAITNKLLQEKLSGTKWAKGMNDKKLSSRISRHLSLLRAHGLIRKLPNQRKYALTDKGKKITTAMGAALAASTEDLMSLAA